MKSRFLTSFILLFLAGTALVLSADEIQNLKADLNKRGKDFIQHRLQARDKVVQEIDKQIKNVKNANFNAAIKSQRLKTLNDARAEFIKDGTFADSEDLLPIEIAYVDEIWKYYGPLLKVQDRLLNAYIKTNDTEGQKYFEVEKEKYEKLMPGSDKLRPGTFWPGTVYWGNGGSVRWHFRITKVEGGTFVGHVDDNPGVGGHWEYDVGGIIDGNRLSFVRTKVVAGSTYPIAFEGYVVGDEIIMRYRAQPKANKVDTGLIRVRLKL